MTGVAPPVASRDRADVGRGVRTPAGGRFGSGRVAFHAEDGRARDAGVKLAGVELHV